MTRSVKTAKHKDSAALRQRSVRTAKH